MSEIKEEKNCKNNLESELEGSEVSVINYI
jgi:hypothetical protein